MKTILAAIDFSPVSSRVLAQSVALARTFQARVIVVNVTPLPVYVPEDYGLSATVDVTTAVRDYALKELKRIERDLKHKGVETTTFHTTGYPGAMIGQCAKKFRADLIVIGSHGHTAFYDLVVGSAAHVVLKRATCPVLVVPAASARKPGRSVKRS